MELSTVVRLKTVPKKSSGLLQAPLVKNSKGKYSHHGQKFRFGTFDHGATECHYYQYWYMHLIALQLKVLNRNFRSWCDYFFSEFSSSEPVKFFTTILVTPWSKVPIRNIRTWCDQMHAPTLVIMAFAPWSKVPNWNFHCGAPISSWNFRPVVHGVTPRFFGTVLLAPRSNIPIWNFQPWCYYFLQSELLSIVRLVPIIGTLDHGATISHSRNFTLWCDDLLQSELSTLQRVKNFQNDFLKFNHFLQFSFKILFPIMSRRLP